MNSSLSTMIQLLKQALPTSNLPEVIAALRQDEKVWNYLTDPEKIRQASKEIGSQTKGWNPSVLGLLALELPGTPPVQIAQHLQDDLQNTVDLQLRRLAVQTFEAFTSESNAEILEPGKAWLLALALRERRRLVGSWLGLVEELSQKAPNRVECKNLRTWETPLACLFGLIPDPLELLSSILDDSASSPERCYLVLHAVLCQPLSKDEQVELIYTLGSGLAPDYRSKLLQILHSLRPQLAAETAQRLIVTNAASEFTTSVDDSEQINNIQFSWRLAETFRLAGENTKAAEGYMLAGQAALKLQARLIGKAGQIALETGHINEAISNFEKSASISTEPKECYVYKAGLSRAKMEKGSLEEASTIILELQQQPYREITDPGCLNTTLTSALIAFHKGDRSKSIDIAYELLESIKAGANLLDQSELFRLAVLLADLEQATAAVEASNLALSFQRNNPALLSFHSTACQKAGQEIEALSSAQLAAILDPGNLDLRRNLASLLEKAGLWKAALEERYAVISEAPDATTQIHDRLALAKCSLQAGQPDIAQEICQVVLSSSEDEAINAKAHWLIGEGQACLGKYQSAQEHLASATRLLPDLTEAWLASARIYRETGYPGRALETLRAAAQASPENYEVHLAIGEAYLGDWEGRGHPAATQAVQSLQQARKLAQATPLPENINNQIVLRLGQALRHLGHFDQARQILEPVYNASPNFAELANTYAQVLLALDEPRAALPALETVLKSAPDDPMPYCQYARTLMSLSEKPDEAVKALRQALKISPDLAEAQAALAEALEFAGILDQALPAYQAALETSLVQDQTWRARLAAGLGRVALALSKTELAVAALEEAASASPESPLIAYRLSEAYQAAGCIDEAVRAGRSALRLGLESLETLSWFADQSLKWVEAVGQNRKESKKANSIPWEIAVQLRIEALNALIRAVEMAPQNAELRLKLAEMQRQTEDIPAAIETFKLVGRLEQAGVGSLYQAAKNLIELKEAKSAISCLERAMHIVRSRAFTDEPGSVQRAQLFETLVTAYRSTGSNQLALDAIEEGISASPQTLSLYQMKADLLFDLGRYPEAIQTIKQALALAPEGSETFPLREKAVIILRAVGQITEALQDAAALIESYKSPEQTADELSARLMAAELARSMLLPERAFAFLAPDPLQEIDLVKSVDETLSSNSRRNLLIEYLCLRAELAYEISESDLSAGAAQNLAYAEELAAIASGEITENNRVRLKVLQARQQARLGNAETGLEILLACVAGEDWSVSDKTAEHQGNHGDQKDAAKPLHLPSFKHLNNLLSVGLASIEFGQWDTALFVLRRAGELAPGELFSFFHHARALTLRAEMLRFCQDLKAINHAPGEEAVGEHNQLAFEQSMRIPLEALTSWSSDPENPFQASYEIVLPALRRWKARGQAAFEPGLNTAQALIDLCGSSATATESAAIIASIRYVEEEKNEAVDGVNGHKPPANIAALASQAARVHPQNSYVLVQLALTLKRQKEYIQDAYKAARQALQLHRRKATFMVNSPLPLTNDQGAAYQIILAQLAYHTGEMSLAAEAVANALNAWPREARWHAFAAEIAVERNDFNTAIPHLEQAVVLEPRCISHYLALGQAYLSQAGRTGGEEENSTERAIQILEQACRMIPERPEAYLALARAYLQAGDLPRASQYTELTLTLANDQTQALLLSCEIALKKHDYQEAYDRFQTALQNQENQHILHDPQTALLLVRALKGLGRLEPALSTLETALTYTNDPLPLLLEKVRILESSEGAEKAVEALYALNERFPDHPRLLMPFAAALEKIGENEMAVVYAQKAIQTSNQSPALTLEPREQARLHFLLGRLLHGAGQLDQAVHHLNETIQLVPDMVDAYLELGLTQQERRQTTQAIKIYEQAARVAPRDPRPYYHAGVVLREGKDYAASESMLRRAAELAPDDLTIHRQLAAIIALNLVHNGRRRISEE